MINTVMVTNSTTASFSIPIQQNKNGRTVNIASLLMLLISLGAFLFNAAMQHQVWVVAFTCALLLLALYWLYRVFINKPVFIYLNIILLLASVYWFIQGSGLAIFMGIMLVIAALFERRLKMKHVIYISPAGVTLQTSLNKTLTWAQLANVIVKDGLLTIDTKSNKLYQKEVAVDFTAENEAEINEFCRLRLIANR